jgi:hypothetical protein
VAVALATAAAVAIVASAAFLPAASAEDHPGIEWSLILGGSGSDLFTAAAAAPDGGAALAAESDSSDGDFGPTLGGTDAWIVRLAPDGSVQWMTRIAGSDNEWVEWLSAAEDGGWLALGFSLSADGDFVVPQGKNGSRRWAARLDSSGKLLWLRFLDAPEHEHSWPVAVAQPDGGLLIAHLILKAKDGVPADGFETGLQVSRIAPAGRLSKAFFAALPVSESSHVWELAAAAGPEGDLAVAYRAADGGSYPLHVAAFSPAGKLLWDSPAGDDADAADIGRDLAESPDESPGNFYRLMALPEGGWTGSATDRKLSWLFGVASDGSDAWTARVPRNGIVRDIDLADGGLLSAGYILGGRDGDEDLLAILTDQSGAFQWSAVLGGSGNDAANTAAGLSDGGLLIAGHTESRDGHLTAWEPSGQAEGTPSAWAVKLGP